MEAKFCPQCGTKLKEDALFCSECGYKIKDKIGTEDLNTNTISKSEVPEIKNEGNKISCNESKKSISDYINIFKEKWHLSKKITIVIIAAVLFSLLLAIVLLNNPSKGRDYSGKGTITSVDDSFYEDDDEYFDKETQKVMNSIEDDTISNNKEFEVYYKDDKPFIDFEIENDTKYYINWVDVVIEFDDHTYAHTVFDIDSYSSESLPIELDFEPSEGDTIKFNVTVKDISLFEDEDDDYDY